MRATLAIAGREWRSYFLTPAGYLIVALFVLMSGLAFLTGFDQGRPASMRPVFGVGIFLLLVIGPAISMRLLAEEYRLGTAEMLLSAPVNATQIVLGKFLAALGFLAALLIPTLIYVVLLEFYGRPDYGEIGCGYLGMILAGAAFLAAGTFASTLTASQVVAFLLSLFFWVLLVTGSKMLPVAAASWWPEAMSSRSLAALAAFDPDPKLKDFSIGLIDTANVVYFLAITGVFLAAAVRWLGVRRWG